MLLLADDGHVYQSICCALPHRIVHPCLENDAILQISAGWTHSAVFLKSGTILIFWPYDSLLTEEYRLGHGAGPRQHIAQLPNEESIDTHIFDYAPEAVTLPPIRDETVTQVANAEDAILALTVSGRVYRMGLSGRRGLRGNERIQDINDMFIGDNKRWNEVGFHFFEA